MLEKIFGLVLFLEIIFEYFRYRQVLLFLLNPLLRVIEFFEIRNRNERVFLNDRAAADDDIAAYGPDPHALFFSEEKPELSHEFIFEVFDRLLMPAVKLIAEAFIF